MRAWPPSSALSWRAWPYRRPPKAASRELTNGVAELLVPFFLVGIGLHFDVSAFAGGRTLALAGVLLVAAVLSKFLGCGVGALGVGRTDAIRVGVGMVPRGEVGMVVAQIGLNMGVIGQGIYGIIVFMSVATTLIAPPLLKLAFGSPTEGGTGNHPPGLTASCGYNIGDVTKYIRYQSASGVSYGTLEGDTVHQIQGDLFDGHTPTGATHPLSDVKLLYPCAAQQDPGRRIEL